MSMSKEATLAGAAVAIALAGGSRCFAPATPSASGAPATSRAVSTALRGAGREASDAAGIGGATTGAALAGIVAAAAGGQRVARGRGAASGGKRAKLVAVRAEAEPAVAEKKAAPPAPKEKAAPPAKLKADPITDAAAVLSKAAYPFMKEVPWGSTEFMLTPGSPDPIGWAKAIGKIIDMGAEMDSELVKAGCEAHHNANSSLKGGSGVCSEAELTAILAAIGRMIASVPESKTMEVYNAVSALVDKDVPAYLMAKVSEENAKAAYAALLKFVDVVKANPITPSSESKTKVSGEATMSINAAAADLATAAYPFMKGVDWKDSLYAKTPPGKTAGQVLAAVDKMIVMGSKMDGPALKEAAKAHVKAIEGVDRDGVLTQEDFEAVLAGLGKAISSVPTTTVMGVYDEMGKVAGVNTGIPAYLFQKQNPGDAIAAYDALLRFKDTVRANQPDAIGDAAVGLASATYPFMKEVPWNSDEFLLRPGTADSVSWARAVGKIIDMGADMDPELVKAGCDAHHSAITDLPADGVCSEEALAKIYAAIGRMVASVPESKTMGVYNSLVAIVDKEVPAYLMSKVSEANAKKAYDALIKFTQVVRANPITPSTAGTRVSSLASSSITAAANALGEAAYPFMQGVDWTDTLYTKPPPGKSAQEVLKAVDKMIVMGSQMDGPALQEAAKAHVAAIGNMDSKGVLTKRDFQTILAGLGKAISSVPESSVMGVYDAMGKIAGESSGIPNYLFQKQNPVDAVAAYDGLMKFKDTVRSHQPDAIGAAAARLATAAQPFIKQVPWNSDEFLLAPGAPNPIGWAKAIGKIIDMGASMDAGLVKAGCEAHHAAITGLPPSGVASQAKMADIYAAIGRMIASVPEAKTMGVYDAVKDLVDPKVPAYLMSKVSEADAKAAYEALVEFSKVVKANPITPFSSATTVSSSDAVSIDKAAKELSAAAYPFMTGVDWTDDLYTKPLPGKSAQQVLAAVDKMIMMGSKMDGAALKDAAMAHVKAIEGMDSKGVLKQADFEAILAGLGKAISTVPTSTVMGVYSEMSSLVGGNHGPVPAYLYAKQNQGDAVAAYKAVIEFKDSVEAAQPKPPVHTDANDPFLVVLGLFSVPVLTKVLGLLPVA